MASQPFDFNTGDFSCSVRSLAGFVLGATMIPAVSAQVGGALLRAMYEHMATGLMIGDLQAGPPARPSAVLAPGPTGLRMSQAIASDAQMYADDQETISWSDLSPYTDDHVVTVVVADTGYVASKIAAPTLKAWCEALGGTYTDL